jgi:hypothetical protein
VKPPKARGIDMATFTMQQFIDEKKLGVDLGNPQATRMIAKKLKESGYRQIRIMYEGQRQGVWTNEADPLSDLAKKLASLKL